MAVALNDLIGSYHNAVARLIPLVTELRGSDPDIKINDLNNCFRKSVEGAGEWEPDHKGGHKKFKHKVTHIVVEYQAHSSSKDRTVKAHIQVQILNQVQAHLNILCNDIFQYRFQNWKHAPDFNTSLVNYNAWAHRR